jgi:hypothetical protein
VFFWEHGVFYSVAPSARQRPKTTQQALGVPLWHETLTPQMPCAT